MFPAPGLPERPYVGKPPRFSSPCPGRERRERVVGVVRRSRPGRSPSTAPGVRRGPAESGTPPVPGVPGFRTGSR